MVHHHFAPRSSGNSEFSRELQPPALFGEEHTHPHSSRIKTLKSSASARYSAKTKDKQQPKA